MEPLCWLGAECEVKGAKAAGRGTEGAGRGILEAEPTGLALRWPLNLRKRTLLEHPVFQSKQGQRHPWFTICPFSFFFLTGSDYVT